ncbi:unnamed protein product [Adineta ricciae]|uniref:Uncharacterized protein n=1 Tax=Adineta ricciae TaxID=249248 RepID=A0A814M1L7_ADIRI|nr:unnamed protein product [Adineta ricciae]CAF1419171.1 unnamed protein product [Adineta ricciae]
MNSWDAERQRKLDSEFDNVYREHERLEQDLASNQYPNYQPLIDSIDKWEQDAIKRIQKTAKKARDDVQRVLKKTKQQLQHALYDTVTEELRDTLDKKNKLTEFCIDQWLVKLSELRKQYENLSSSVQFSYKNAIQLIRIDEASFAGNKFPARPYRFKKIRGRVTFFHAECLISFDSPSVILSQDKYSTGTHYFHFRVEKSAKELFFGFVSTIDYENLQKNLQPIESMYGWWNIDRRVLGGRKEPYVSALNIYGGDEIILMINCRAGEIFLEYPSMTKLNSIKVPDTFRSHSWQVMIETGQPGKCLLRILDWGLVAHGKKYPGKHLHCFCEPT